MKKNKYTDIHHHLLYGLDDGADKLATMKKMLEKAAEDNIGRIVVTPHVTPGVKRFDIVQYERALEEARSYCEAHELGIEVYAGAEILYTSQTCSFLLDGRVPTMAGTDHVLVEFSPDIRYEKLKEALDTLLRSGYLPIIAHVERYACLAHKPSLAEKIKEELDVYYQVNCSSILGGKDKQSDRFVEKLLDWDLVDALGTDAHSPTVRAVHMREAWKKLKKEFGASYADELTDGHLLFELPGNR